MQITWKGAASFVLEAAGEKILFDPFVELIGGAHPDTLDDFEGYDTIFVTHCHFDHLFFSSMLIEGEEPPTVFCSPVSAKTLEEMEEDTDTVAVYVQDQPVDIGRVRIIPRRAKHIKFKWRYLYMTMTPFRVIRYIRNMPFLLWANRNFKEQDETMAFEIHAEGRTILLLGSLNLDYENGVYPDHPDLLILPYQGNNDLVTEADKILARIQPKRVLLSHFDNAFPPMSREEDLRPLRKLLAEKYPDIVCVKPSFNKPVTLNAASTQSGR